MDVVGRSLHEAKIIHCRKVDCPRRIFLLFLLFSQFGLIISLIDFFSNFNVLEKTNLCLVQK